MIGSWAWGRGKNDNIRDARREIFLLHVRILKKDR